MPYMPGANEGHGHVWERPDGVKARCGGPGLCKICSRDKVAKDRFREKHSRPNSDGFNDKMELEPVDIMRQAYLSLLRVPVQHRFDVRTQAAMAKLRDFIAGHEGLDAETIQIRFEQTAERD